jgi:hypothetical protein
VVVEAKQELLVDNIGVELAEDNKPVGAVVHNNLVGLVVVDNNPLDLVVDDFAAVDNLSEVVAAVEKLAELVMVLYYSFDQMADYPVV